MVWNANFRDIRGGVINVHLKHICPRHLPPNDLNRPKKDVGDFRKKDLVEEESKFN